MVSGLILTALVSCERIKEKFQSEGGQDANALTAEEKEMNAILENPDIYAPVEEEVVAEDAFVLNKAAQVSVLCYHDFTTGKSSNPMKLNVDDFRAQMQALKDADIPVVPMSEFLAWMRGEQNVPDPCVVITIDDGWRAVYELALPVFKEFDYPFTVYLYKNYINTGGRSMTHDEIRELMKHKGEIGSHSVSHRDMSSRGGRSPEDYETWLRKEFRDSWDYLEEHFKVKPVTFAYPYGKYNQLCVDIAKEMGHEAAFTVNGKRVVWEVERGEIGRFVIHGDNDINFRLGTSFRGGASITGTEWLSPEDEDSKVTVSPLPEEKITERLPEIVVNLSGLGKIDESSLQLKVSGFGRVPYDYDPQNRVVRYQVPQRLRSASYQVHFQVKEVGQAKPYLVPWRFYVEPTALYLGEEEGEPEVDSER